MPQSDNMVELKGICKNFGSLKAVDHLDLQIKQGDIFGFLGQNGSGKTTTIRMICGMLTPSAGSGRCLNYDLLKDAAQISSHVGYMPQRFSLYSYLSVYDNLLLSAKLFNIKKHQPLIDDVMERLNLIERRKQLAGTLSGGWKQRLALAAALVHKPKLLLLDEPTAGVDPNSRWQFWEIISDLANEGVTVLVSTHYMVEAERCTNLIYLIRGQKIITGSSREIVDKTKLFTIRIFGGDILQHVKRIRTLDGVEQVVTQGKILHISAKDISRLKESLWSYLDNPDYQSDTITPTLEDVLINLEISFQEKSVG